MCMSYKAKQYAFVPTICLKNIALPARTFGALCVPFPNTFTSLPASHPLQKLLTPSVL